MVTMPTMPSSSTEMSAPVSAWMALMTLPFGPMTSPILSIGISKLMIFGAVARHLGARGSAMAAFMTSRICEAGFLGLLERGGQHVGGDAVDLGVELEGGDELGGAGDLEVHVAEGVLGAEDVGEGGVLALGVDEAHGDAGDGALIGTPASISDSDEPSRPTPSRSSRSRQHLGHEAERVGELLQARHDRQQGRLGEQAVADLAALRRRRMKPVSPLAHGGML
jgi:hypothetical protein